MLGRVSAIDGVEEEWGGRIMLVEREGSKIVPMVRFEVTADGVRWKLENLYLKKVGVQEVFVYFQIKKWLVRLC